MIIVRCKGGLGNQLFQYAAGRALAARHGVSVRIDSSWYRSEENRLKVHRTFDLTWFQTAAETASEADLQPFAIGESSFPARVAARAKRALTGRQVWADHEMGYNNAFERLGPETLLEGFFQHPRYFETVSTTLRKEFQLRAVPAEEIVRLAREVAVRPTVCVQVRRSDYVAHADDAALHGVCGRDYYRRAWKEVTAREPAAEAWVFTDDAAWARAELNELRPVRIIQEDLGGPPYLEKFFVMRACRHFVSANSTYGWWAAWLGAKPGSVVVLPRQWLRGRDVDALGLRLPGWIAG